VAAGYIVEFTFGGLGLIPATRSANVTATGITWNYTTVLNIIFLLLAAALLVRFFRSGATPMLKMMGGTPGQHEPEYHAHPELGASRPRADRAPLPRPDRSAGPGPCHNR
jgi:hypothetical protein